MVKSLYIHIPFCRKKCLYCDFYSIEYQKDIAISYISALCKQIESLKENFSTIYIGGGTPTILDIALWGKLLSALEKVSRRIDEFTIEANPESLDEAKIRLFLERKINRISIGTQSFNREKLKKLGRIHTFSEAINAVSMARKQGFDNINIDLIFGVWGEDLDGWKKELKEAVKLPITHISLYSLTYEKNTPLFREMKKGKITPLDEDAVVQMLKYNEDYLSKKGFFRYEVSNFSKKGYQCRHNLNYWQNNSYLGLGPSAVSFLQGQREKNTLEVTDYISKLKKGISPVISKEKLSRLARAKETAALKIRTKEGIEFKRFETRTGFNFIELQAKAIEELTKEGLLKYRRKNRESIGVYLTEKGFLFCDRVSSNFL